MIMKTLNVTLLLVLLVLQLPATFCTPWWSIVSGSDVFNPSNRKAPIHLQCNSFSSILNSEQLQLCKRHHKLLSTTAIGVLQALNQCQKLFKDRSWNCSVFESEKHYLGLFVENGTRETAFLNAIISAGIAREVARKCREQELDACGCDFTVGSGQKGNISVIGGCGDNDKFGVQIAKEFTDTSLVPAQDAVSLAAVHNNKVGRALVEETTVECICHGVSGSCSVQTCFKKVPDIEQLAIDLQRQYDVAKHVKKDNNKLKPVERSAPPLGKKELAYIEFSPNFCKRDLANGIYGTSGRRCYPDRSDYSSCANLCCGGPVEQRTVEVKEDLKKCCEVIWCCRLDCSKCRTFTETQYFCK